MIYNIGEYIKARRIELGLTQKRACRRLMYDSDIVQNRTKQRESAGLYFKIDFAKTRAFRKRYSFCDDRQRVDLQPAKV